MGAGPPVALVSGRENLTNTRVIYRSWVTSHRSFDTSCRSTGLMDMALSHRQPVAPGASSGPQLRPPARCCHCLHRCRRLCRLLILTGTLAREQAVSGSGATALWVVLGTGQCPTMARGTGTAGPGVGGSPGRLPGVTGPERCRGTENVSCPSYVTFKQ